MGKFIDLTGKVFGRLTVLERAENQGGRACWKCVCSCGNEVVVQGGSLKNGLTRSCGCWNREKSAQRRTTHSMADSKIYRTWHDIKTRCYNPNCKGYKDYGGRGITMYAPWINDFQAFFDYVSRLEHFGEEGISIDRIDNDGNYEPGNLRWTDRKTQARNTRKNAFVEYNGEQMALSEAAEKSGINYRVLENRYRRGDRGDRLFRAVETKYRNKK